MINKTNKMTLGMVFLISILSLSLVSSFAVSSKYWEDNPLPASPGESIDFFVVLQNIAGEGGDLRVEGSITQGTEIAEFKDESTFLVPFGEKVNVYLTAEVPEDASNGDIINIVLSFRTVPENNGEALGIGSSVERTIPIKVVTAENSYTWVWILIAAVIIIVVAILLVRRRNN